MRKQNTQRVRVNVSDGGGAGALRAQGIDDDNVIVDRVRQAHGLSNGQGGVGREQGMHDASEVLETTTEASRIQGRQQRLRHRDDGSEELATTTEASAEEDEPGDC